MWNTISGDAISLILEVCQGESARKWSRLSARGQVGNPLSHSQAPGSVGLQPWSSPTTSGKRTTGREEPKGIFFRNKNTGKISDWDCWDIQLQNDKYWFSFSTINKLRMEVLVSFCLSVFVSLRHNKYTWFVFVSPYFFYLHGGHGIFA